MIRLNVMALVVLGMIAPADFLRETNSDAANRRGVGAYEQQQYAAAAQSFARAQQLAPSARGAFNLGTAEIAAGRREQGSARLEEAIRDPELRANALFNRGNSALAAKALDHAVRDYTAALRANPRHEGAKRNLEIALMRREEQRRGGARGSQDEKGQPQPQQQQPSPAPGQQRPQRGEIDLEALLRSVQQQEQDELRRMKGQATEGRVGW